jgi:hypothetical protein
MKKTFLSVLIGIAVVMLLSLPAHASLSLTASTDKDTMVVFVSEEGGLGGRGAMEIAAPTSDQNRTQEVMLSWNTASLKSQFDAQYGVGGWVVTSVTVTFGSNNPSAGTQPNNSRFNIINPGFFTLSWLSNDSWSESIMYSDLYKYLPGEGSNTEELLGTYYYFADGIGSLTWYLNNTPGLIADILSGSAISILGEPGDTSAGYVGYLINQNNGSFGGPILTITADAAPVPIPPAFFLLGSGMAGIGLLRKRFTLKTIRKGGRV